MAYLLVGGLLLSVIYYRHQEQAPGIHEQNPHTKLMQEVRNQNLQLRPVVTNEKKQIPQDEFSLALQRWRFKIE
jgi:hypothetical protein